MIGVHVDHMGYGALRVFDNSRLEDNQAGIPLSITITTHFSLGDLHFSPNVR